jgi:hypothetical protein
LVSEGYIRKSGKNHEENKCKKATGADKIVKASKSVIAPQLSTLINITVEPSETKIFHSILYYYSHV